LQLRPGARPTRSIKNQSDGLDSGIFTSIELSSSSRQHLVTEEAAILTMTKMGLSETLLWYARAGQARRVASMLSPQDAALVEAYAMECEGHARAVSIEGDKVNNRRLIGTPHIADPTFVSPARSRLPKQAA
jgi:hypothetical protein